MKKDDERNKDDEFYKGDVNFFWLKNRSDKNLRIFMLVAFLPIILLASFIVSVMWVATKHFHD